MVVDTFTALPAFRPLLIFSSLLVLKMGAVAFATANARRKAQVVVNPEDIGVNPGAHAEAQEAPTTARTKRAHMNDVENIPGFLALALLFTLLGAPANAGWAYFGLYFAARTLHTICYLNELQPWRTIVFFIGQLTQLGILVQIVLKVLR